MKRFAALALALGCTTPIEEPSPSGSGCGGCAPPVTGPASVVAPDPGVFEQVSAGASTISVDAVTTASVAIDLTACTHQRLFAWLGLGSAWFLVHPIDDALCELWLGGETENPNYDGSPAQYCQFDRANTLYITLPDGGPVILQNMPWCVLL